MTNSAIISLSLTTATILVAAMAFSSPVTSDQAYAQGQAVRAVGSIASIQNDNNGNAAWLTSGNWKLVVQPAQGNATNATALFKATFIMVMLDGTSKQMHKMSDFMLTRMSSDNSTMTLTGTATITLKDAPKQNVPVTIKLMNHNVISIAFDTSAVNHFGNTPNYGAILRENLQVSPSPIGALAAYGNTHCIPNLGGTAIC